MPKAGALVHPPLFGIMGKLAHPSGALISQEHAAGWHADGLSTSPHSPAPRLLRILFKEKTCLIGF